MSINEKSLHRSRFPVPKQGRQNSIQKESVIHQSEDSFTGAAVPVESGNPGHTDSATHCSPFPSMGKFFRRIYNSVAHPNGATSAHAAEAPTELLSPDRLIHHIYKHNNRQALKKIRGHKVNLNVKGVGGMTPIQHAVRCENKTITRALVAAGVELNQTDLFDNAPIHVVISTGSEAMFNILMDSGAIDIDKPGSMRNTPVHVACGRKNSAFLSRLLKAGARIDQADTFGHKPIHTAVEKHFPEHIRLLIGAGANVNEPDRFAQTPLDDAVRFISRHNMPDRAVETITLLLQHGAKPGNVTKFEHFDISKVPNPRTLEGLSVMLDDARQRGDETLVQLLEQQPGIGSGSTEMVGEESVGG